MNIALRVDASAQVGTGHFMRCLTLADALKAGGAKIHFVCRYLPDHLLGMLRDRGHGLSLIEAMERQDADSGLSHAHWLGASQADDAVQTMEALSGRLWEWLIVDHYALDARWESMLRGSVEKIAVIDDIADRAHDCDLLLDQNLQTQGSGRYVGKVPEQCTLLLGPKYALLREEFREAGERVMARDGAVARVLIFFGGVDAANYTGCAIDALAGIGIPGLHVDVVVGSRHPQSEQIKAKCLANGFVCHVQSERMAQLIAAADLGIGAGGTAVWERCCLGLPTLTLCVAQNQRDQIAEAARAGLLYAPELRGDCVAFIQLHARALIENRFLRQAMSCAAMRAVDARGVGRVVGSLICGNIEIRAASAGDSRNLFEWRNDPSVRAVSRTGDLIDWNTHRNWLASVLNAPDRCLLIGERKGSPVGVVRFDLRGAVAEISIYLVPGPRLPGRGRGLLKSAERWLGVNRPAVAEIRAVVLADNERSEHLFAGAGYKFESSEYTKRLGGQ